MTNKRECDCFRNRGLLPFQVEFATRFVESPDRPFQELVAPPGTGKTRLAATLIAHELEHGSGGQILVFAPAPLLYQWQFELSSVAPKWAPLVVDRKAYLELESLVPIGESPWPRPAIILMSIDLAKRDDMTEALCRTSWDLAVIDESHLLTGKRKELFEKLTGSGVVRRALLLTATPSRELEKVATRVVDVKDIVDWQGTQLFREFQREVNTIDFCRTDEEIAFLQELQNFSERLADLAWFGKRQAFTILHAASSSVYGAETSLRRLQDLWSPIRNKIVHDLPLGTEDIERFLSVLSTLDEESELVEESPPGMSVARKEFLGLYEKLQAVLDQIDDISSDTKMQALVSYLRSQTRTTERRYTCILCAFLSTATYLVSSIESIGKSAYWVTGAVPFAERAQRLEGFRTAGGILVGTDSVLEGIDLQYVDECVNFDLPTTSQRLEQRWTRFMRFGRTKELRMVFLRDESGKFGWEEELWKRLMNLVKEEEVGEHD